MGCVTTKKANLKKEDQKNDQEEYFNGMMDMNYQSVPNSPSGFQKIVQMGAITPNEIQDFIMERRLIEQVRSQSHRCSPTRIYRYKGSNSNLSIGKTPTRTFSKATNCSPSIRYGGQQYQ